MSKYKHNTAKTQRDAQFVLWCRENVKEWPSGAKALASFAGSKFKNYHERSHYASLSHLWAVCTRAQWMSKQSGELV